MGYKKEITSAEYTMAVHHVRIGYTNDNLGLPPDVDACDLV